MLIGKNRNLLMSVRYLIGLSSFLLPGLANSAADISGVKI
jgi:hypothetical protein